MNTLKEFVISRLYPLCDDLSKYVTTNIAERRNSFGEISRIHYRAFVQPKRQEHLRNIHHDGVFSETKKSNYMTPLETSEFPQCRSE